jgi:hypothetical protein
MRHERAHVLHDGSAFAKTYHQPPIEQMRIVTTFAIMALLGTATACTDDDPIAGGMASASASITDDASSQSALRSGGGASDQVAADGHFSGSFTGNAEVAISTDGEMWVDLGNPAQVTVALQSNGEETTIHSRTAIQPGTYTRVRLTLSSARADVDAGATLGGVSFTGAVSINVGGADQRVVIEKQVQPFTVQANTHARILFDLNSEGWIHQGSAEEGSAEDQEVQDSTDARTEVEPE